MDDKKQNEKAKIERTQLTFSLTKENKEKLQRIAAYKGMTMAGVLSSWISDYDDKIKSREKSE